MSTYYTSKYSGEQIDEAVKKIMDGEMTGDYADRQLSNLDTPQGALANLGAGVRPSLVDNGIFVGANLPVNQRGETSWESRGYHIDRWLCEENVVGSVDDQGFHIASGQTVIQPVDEATRDYLLGKTITVSCLLSDGSFATATDILPDTMTENLGVVCHPKFGVEYSLAFFYTAQSYQVGRIANITEQEVTVVACKTELGSTQTLAYQDDTGSWQLLPQPESDYATQLLKCQRYLAAMEDQAIVRSAYVSTNFVDFLVPIPVSFRVLPIIQSAEKLVLITQPDGTKVSGVTWSIATKSSASVRLRASKPNIWSEGTDFSVYTDSGATFFSAEL